MQVNPYLVFNGDCEVAFKFYEQVLGSKIEMMMPHEGTPMANHGPEGWNSKILHASMMVGDTRLMGSDAPPAHYKKPQGMSVSLLIEGAAEAERVFATLAENGTVTMPIGETFWALRFGMLVDRFGIPWMINCDRPA
jgi:PhnB protein